MPAQPATISPSPQRYKSKSRAAWLALLGGALGLHRFYLHGLRDVWGWAHWLPTALGWVGVQRLRQLGQDDMLAWALVPVFGLMLSLGALFAILHGLTPDEKWDQRHNPGQPGRSTTWAPVLAAVAALLLGGGVLMASITYAVQMFFQWQLAAPTTPAAAAAPQVVLCAAAGGQSVAAGSRSST